MSGPKTSECELEQQKRQRLREALEIRKAAYYHAISKRQILLKHIQTSTEILERKLKHIQTSRDVFKEKRNQSGAIIIEEAKIEEENRDIISAYEEQIHQINHVTNIFYKMTNEPMPEMDDITESESTQCLQADQIQKRTKQLEAEYNSLLADYNRTEERTEKCVKQAEESIRQIIQEYRKASAELSAQRDQCQKNIRQISNHLQSIIDSQASVLEMEHAVSAIRSVRTTLLEQSEALLNRPIPTQTAEEVRALTLQTRQETEALIDRANQDIQGPLEQMKRFAASQQEVSAIIYAFEAQRNRAASSDALTEIKDQFYSEPEAPDPYKALEETMRKELDSILDRIEDAVCNDSVCKEDAQQLVEIYGDIQKTANNSRGSLAAELIQARDILAQVNRRAELFEQCYCRYVTACEMLNQLYERTGEERKRKAVIERSGFASIDELGDEEERISAILTAENEQHFIRKTITEVMRAFGYNMTEGFVLHREQRGTHLLCRKENEDTAIHVHYSGGAKKRFMLEVVGVRKVSESELEKGVNGKIIGTEALSEARRQELLERQTAFCQIHPEIIRVLEEKGIRTSSIELNPPDIEFCEEIAITGAVTEGEEDAAKRGGRKARNARPKEMEMRMTRRKFLDR